MVTEATLCKTVGLMDEYSAFACMLVLHFGISLPFPAAKCQS